MSTRPDPVAHVVVVGGGVIGTMIALFACRRGCSVAQLERESEARGASVRNFGLIWVSGRRRGEELAFALESRSLWEDVAVEVPGIGFRPNGSLTIIEKDDQHEVALQMLARDDAADRRLALLDPRQVQELNPAVRGSVLAGLHCAADAAVEPRLVPAALRERLLEYPGYRWLPGRHVVAVHDRSVRDHLGTRHEADVVLVCPGAAHRGLAGWSGDAAPLRRVRLQMLQTEPFAESVTTSIADADSLRYYPAFDVPALALLPAPPPLVAEHQLQLLLQQRLDGALTIGDTHTSTEPFPVDVVEAPYEHLLRRAESILGRSLPPVRQRWAGVYSQATDQRLFYAEQVGSSAWLVTGAGGRGMTLAPAIAQRVLGDVGV